MVCLELIGRIHSTSQILKEQTKQRKSKKRSRDKNEHVEGSNHKKSLANNLDRSDVNADHAVTSSSGALALSSLVKNLKSKVAKISN